MVTEGQSRGLAGEMGGDNDRHSTRRPHRACPRCHSRIWTRHGSCSRGCVSSRPRAHGSSDFGSVDQADDLARLHEELLGLAGSEFERFIAVWRSMSTTSAAGLRLPAGRRGRGTTLPRHRTRADPPASEAMMPQPTDPIHLDASIWRVAADPGPVESAARAWRDMGPASVGCGDGLVGASARCSVATGRARSRQLRRPSVGVRCRHPRRPGRSRQLAVDSWTVGRTASALPERSRCRVAAITARVRANTVHLPFIGDGSCSIPYHRKKSPPSTPPSHGPAPSRPSCNERLPGTDGVPTGDWTALAARSFGGRGPPAPRVVPAARGHGRRSPTSVLMVDGRAVINTVRHRFGRRESQPANRRHPGHRERCDVTTILPARRSRSAAETVTTPSPFT